MQKQTCPRAVSVSCAIGRPWKEQEPTFTLAVPFLQAGSETSGWWLCLCPGAQPVLCPSRLPLPSSRFMPRAPGELGVCTVLSGERSCPESEGKPAPYCKHCKRTVSASPTRFPPFQRAGTQEAGCRMGLGCSAAVPGLWPPNSSSDSSPHSSAKLFSPPCT